MVWPALAWCWLGGLGLRLWGVQAGPALRLQHRRGRPFRAARGADVPGGTLNPHYFANPPAFTYLLHCRLRGLRTAARAGRCTRSRCTPTSVYTLARVTVAVLGTLALWLLYADRRAPVRSRASGCSQRRSRLSPSCRSSTRHLALNDAPTLAPLTLSLLGSAGMLRKGRRRDYLLAGVGLGLACASKYTAGIVALAAAGGERDALPGDATARARRPAAVRGSASRWPASRRSCAFLIANPYAVLDYSGFHAELVHQSTLSAEAPGQARRAARGRHRLLPVGVHVGPRLGAVAGGARRGVLALWRTRAARWLRCWCPRRCCSLRSWACRAATSAAGCCRSSRSSACWRRSSRRWWWGWHCTGRRAPMRRAGGCRARCGGAERAVGVGRPGRSRALGSALVVVRCCRAGPRLQRPRRGWCSRARTRETLTRAWMLANVPSGTPDRGRAGVTRRMGARSQARALRPRATPIAGSSTRRCCRGSPPTARSSRAATPVGIEDYERTLARR